MRNVFLVCLFLLMTGCTSGNMLSGDIQPTIKESLKQGEEVLIASDQGMDWSLETSDKFSEEYYVFEPIAPSSIKGIFAGDLFVLTPDKYEKFKELRNCKTCPANFLNNNATILLVLTEKKDIVNRLKTLKEGDKIILEGYDLDYGVTTSEGVEVDFSLDSKARPVYLQNVTVK